MPAIKGEPNICYYCGMVADTVDHVVPQSTLRSLKILDDTEITKKVLRNRRLLVWACSECNSLAGKSLQDNITARKKYIHNKIRKKYRNYLDTPHWSETELLELAPDMARYVRNSLHIKDVIKKRLGMNVGCSYVQGLNEDELSIESTNDFKEDCLPTDNNLQNKPKKPVKKPVKRKKKTAKQRVEGKREYWREFYRRKSEIKWTRECVVCGGNFISRNNLKKCCSVKCFKILNLNS